MAKKDYSKLSAKELEALSHKLTGQADDLRDERRAVQAALSRRLTEDRALAAVAALPEGQREIIAKLAKKDATVIVGETLGAASGSHAPAGAKKSAAGKSTRGGGRKG